MTTFQLYQRQNADCVKLSVVSTTHEKYNFNPVSGGVENIR